MHPLFKITVLTKPTHYFTFTAISLEPAQVKPIASSNTCEYCFMDFTNILLLKEHLKSHPVHFELSPKCQASAVCQPDY